MILFFGLSAAAATVTVPVVSSAVTEGKVSPASLSFTTSNWAVAKTVTVTGQGDNTRDGDQTYNVIFGSSVRRLHPCLFWFCFGFFFGGGAGDI